MTTLSAYDLSRAMGKRFKLGLEDYNEFETDDALLDPTVDVIAELDDISEAVVETDETIDSLDDVEQATETLESLIMSMESSVLSGGFDRTNATLANITLESLTTRFKLDTQCLSFGLEEVEDDGEAETKSTIAKAKEMLSALKDNTTALVSKMYISATAALGSNTARSEKLLNQAAKLKANISTENKGTDTVTLKPSVGKYLTNSATAEPLPPKQYLKELKRSLDKYNDVVKTYNDNEVLETFVNDVVSATGGGESEPKSKKLILAAVKTIQSDISTPVKSEDGVEIKASTPYLGNYVITLTRPDARKTAKMVNELLAKEQVTQEGVGTYAGAVVTQALGAMLFVVSAGGFIGGTIGVFGAAGIPLTAVAIAVAVAGYYGQRKAVDVMKNGFDTRREEIAKAISAFKSNSDKHAEEVTEVMTEFEVTGGDMFSAEANDKGFNVNALSSNEISQVISLVENTAATTRNMKKSLAARKSLIKQIDTLTKTMSKAEENNDAIAKSVSTFVKQYLKQTIKFEMDMTTYGVQVMRSALNYAAVSNQQVESAPDNTDTTED